jgi:amidase
MTKSSYDLAALLDVITGRNPSESYTKNLTKSWSDISVAVLDPETWKFPESYVKPAEGAGAQMVR